MILVVLALIWVLALTPTILRKLAEREGSYSVARFHRSLRAMRRAYPGQPVAMAVPAGVTPISAAGRGAGGGPFARSAVPAGAPGSTGSTGAGAGAAVVDGGLAAAPAPVRIGGPTARRRRRVLTVLAGGLFGSFLLGFVPQAHVLWDVSLFLLALTGGYVALLIHFRRAAAERTQKVVYLEAPVLPAVEATYRPRIQPFRAGERPAPARERIGAVRLGGERREPAIVGG